MANADNAMGLRPIGGLNGSPFNGRVGRYYHPSTDSTALYVGALVKPAGSADADGIMTVTALTATGGLTVGVVVGVEPVTRDSTLYVEASTSRYVLVADDPDTLFVVQDDAASVPTASIVGNTADLATFTTGTNGTGRALTEISMATVTASGDGTEDVLILGLQRRPDNEIGNWADWIVRLNNHFYTDAVAGA